MSQIEQKTVFAISPDGTGDGVPVVIFGIPHGAWKYIRKGKTNTFDFTKLGIPLKVIMFGGSSHADVKRMIEKMQAAEGNVLVDMRREDFSIQPKEPPK